MPLVDAPSGFRRPQPRHGIECSSRATIRLAAASLEARGTPRARAGPAPSKGQGTSLRRCSARTGASHTTRSRDRRSVDDPLAATIVIAHNATAIALSRHRQPSDRTSASKPSNIPTRPSRALPAINTATASSGVGRHPRTLSRPRNGRGASASGDRRGIPEPLELRGDIGIGGRRAKCLGQVCVDVGDQLAASRAWDMPHGALEPIEIVLNEWMGRLRAHAVIQWPAGHRRNVKNGATRRRRRPADRLAFSGQRVIAARGTRR